MSVSRDQVYALLASRQPEHLAAVLGGAGLTPRAREAPALAGQLTDALWWNTHTPAGLAVAPASLGSIVDQVARRAAVHLPPGDAWQRLDALTRALLPDASFDALAPHPELGPALGPSLLGTGAAGTAAGTHLAARALLGWTSGGVWRLLPLLPRVGPAWLGLRAAAGTVAVVSGPVGVALALWSLNRVLGPRHDRALPLLLGLGLLARSGVVSHVSTAAASGSRHEHPAA